MKAFHGNKQIKADKLAQVKAHRLADQIIKGQYWSSGKGCAVGCTVHSSDHSAYETEMGIPRVLARLEDRLFEGMSNKRAQKWPEQFLRAIKVGADLSKVADQFLLWLLTDVRKLGSVRGKKAINTVISLYKRRLSGDKPSRDEWSASAYAAYAAAASAYAASAYAAAASAYAADAAYAARRDSYERQADKLIELLREAK